MLQLINLTVGDVVMFKTNRAMVASLGVGILGACIAGYWLGVLANPRGYFTAIIIPSFLFCFLISQWYLKFIKSRISKWAYGILFGGLAGAVSGFVTGGIFLLLLEGAHQSVVFIFISGGLSGVWVGFYIGLTIGTILSLIFRSKIAMFLPETNVKE